MRRIFMFGQLGILLLLTGFLYGRLALQIARQWWKDPNYTHGFFVPAFSLFLGLGAAGQAGSYSSAAGKVGV